MTKTDYPSEVTEDNLKQLNEKAKTIKKRAMVLLYASTILYGIIALASFPILYFVVGRLLLPSLETLPAETSFGITFVVFWVVFFLYVYMLYIFVELGLMLAFKLPRHDERVFAECFIIADYLTNNEKRKAVREVDDFVMHLYSFARSGFYRSKEYAHEFFLLSSGKTPIRRMLLFSENNTLELLRNFGLALVRKEDPKAFKLLNQIVSEVRNYGELKGTLRKILGALEKYQNLFTLLLFIASVILVVLGILPSI